jgi:hypothetical protein
VTRFVVDASVLMRLASDGREASKRHELLAPTLVRSHTLSALHEAVHAGKLPADVARDHLERIWRMKLRLLGDAVLRRRAWEIADQLDVRRRVHRAHAAASGGVRDDGQEARAQRQGHRRDRDDRRAPLTELNR